jgi:RNA-binding protein 15
LPLPPASHRVSTPPSPSNRSSISDKNSASTAAAVHQLFDNDERDATCTLFLGNLDHNVDREELKKLFEKYGVVEDVDVKRHMPLMNVYGGNSRDHNSRRDRLPDNTKTYGFVKFENLDMAVQAKKNMNGKMVLGSETRIGYGKNRTLYNIILNHISLLLFRPMNL